MSLARSLTRPLIALAALALVPACFDFEADLATCRDGGRCTETPDAGPFAATICTSSGSCWEHPWPTGQHLTAVTQVGPDDVWFGGRYLFLLHYDHGVWSAPEVKSDAPSWQVPNAIVPHGDRLLLPTYQDAITWQAGQVTSEHYDNNAYLRDALWMADAGQWVIAGDNGIPAGHAGMIATLDPNGFSGFSTPLDLSPEPSRLSTLLDRGPDGLLAFGEDAGARWQNGAWTVLDATERPAFEVWSAWAAADGTLWAGGTDSVACTEGGVWLPLALPAASHTTVTGVGSTAWVTRDTDVFQCGGCAISQCVKRSPDDAEFGYTPSDQDALSMARAFGNDVWLVGANGYIAHAKADAPDAGYSLLVPGPRDFIIGLYAPTRSDAWAVGQNGLLLHRDAEKGWQQVPGTPMKDLEAVFRDPATSTLLIAGDGVLLRQKKDGSGAFEAAPLKNVDGATSSPSQYQFLAMHGDPSIGTFAVGRYGKVLRWETDHFRELPAFTTEHLLSVFATDGGTVWVGAEHGKLFRGHADGGWDELSFGDAGAPDDLYTGVWAAAPDDVYAAPYFEPRIVHLRPDGSSERFEIAFDPSSAGRPEAITGTPEGDLWVAGNNTLAHRGPGADSFETWFPRTTEEYGAITVMDGEPIAAGAGGSIIAIHH